MIRNLLKLAQQIETDSSLNELVRVKRMTEVHHHGSTYPILAFSIGSREEKSPVLFVTGGIHGLERIGAELAWSFLKTTIDRLIWDQSLRRLFESIRLVVLPLVNPVGYYHFTRCNGNGVDLMRNSPVKATEKVPFLLGGQEYSRKLPWYVGSGQLEPENRALLSAFIEEAGESSCVVSLDLHSGFGLRDRLWFPYSYTSTPFDYMAETHALAKLLHQSHPYHVYLFEPQSKGYLMNGDIWDHLFLEFKKQSQAIFIPLTLEMGSWTWVRKNPLQMFSRIGPFNPIKEHRVKRTYRRHYLLFDFLLKAVFSNEPWSSLDPQSKKKNEEMGLERWF